MYRRKVAMANTHWEGKDGRWIVPRNHLQDRFAEMMEHIGCDIYGYAQESKIKAFAVGDEADGIGVAHYVIDTPLFTIRPYWWGDCESDAERAVMRLPNFEFKPFELEISWYKYPMRNAYANCRLTDDEWDAMCTACERWFDFYAETGRTDYPVEHSDKRTYGDLVAIGKDEELSKLSDRLMKYEDTMYFLLDACAKDDYNAAIGNLMKMREYVGYTYDPGTEDDADEKLSRYGKTALLHSLLGGEIGIRHAYALLAQNGFDIDKAAQRYLSDTTADFHSIGDGGHTDEDAVRG